MQNRVKSWSILSLNRQVAVGNKEGNSEKIRKHRDHSIHYFENAIRFIELGELEKASEFLWGSVAQSLKAVAATKNVSLKSHDDLQEYTRALSRSLRDESIWYIFNVGQSLHSNFYETGLKLEYIEVSAENVRMMLTKLNNLLPEELKDTAFFKKA